MNLYQVTEGDETTWIRAETLGEAVDKWRKIGNPDEWPDQVVFVVSEEDILS